MRLFFLLIPIFIFTSCTSLPLDSIEFGGNLKERTGTITITLDKAETLKENRPVFDQKNVSGEIKKLYTITKEDLDKLLKKLQGDLAVSENKTPYKQMFERLNE